MTISAVQSPLSPYNTALQDAQKAEAAAKSPAPQNDTVSLSPQARAASTGGNTINVGSISNSTINVSGGNSTISVGGDVQNSTIKTGDGDDSVTIGGKLVNSEVDLGEGDNGFSGKEVEGSTLKAGDGNNTFNVTSMGRYTPSAAAASDGSGGPEDPGDGETPPTPPAEARNSTLITGNGNNRLNITDFMNNTDLSMGNGTNELLTKTVTDSSINMGSQGGTGSQTITVSQSTTNSTIDVQGNTNTLSLGTLSFAEKGALKAGGLNTDVKASSITGGSVTLSGSGTNKLSTASLNSEIKLEGNATSSSFINVKDSKAEAKITGGAGTDAIQIKNLDPATIVSMGDNDTLKTTSSKNPDSTTVTGGTWEGDQIIDGADDFGQ